MPLVRKPTGRGPAPTADTLATLKSANPDERWAAARAAGDTDLGALATALRTESDVRVREAMFTSLARIGTAASANQLVPFLRCDDAQLRAGALDALRTMPAALQELLPTLLRDTDTDVRILSCELARSLPSDAATTVLCGLLADEQQVNVCTAAIEVLAEVGNSAALPVLAQCGQRFASAPFVGFAIKIASDRIKAQSPAARG